MTMPSSGQISMGNVIVEFGSSANVGQNISDYYRGAAYDDSVFVPGEYDNTQVVPQAGPISLSNFYNTTGEAGQLELANHWWTNRASYFRTPNLNDWSSYGGSYTGYPGDSHFRNDPGKRYVGFDSGTVGFPNEGLRAISKFTTTITWVSGSNPSFVDIANGYSTLYKVKPGDRVYNSRYINSRVAVAIQTQSNTFTRHLTSQYTSWNRPGSAANGTNSGSWLGIMVLPGRWRQRIEPTTVSGINRNSGNNYVYPLRSGGIMLALFDTDINRDMDTNTLGLTPFSGCNNITGNFYWYNAHRYWVCVNTTGSTINGTWSNVWQPDIFETSYDEYGNPYQNQSQVARGIGSWKDGSGHILELEAY